MDGSSRQASEDAGTSAVTLRFSPPAANRLRPWRIWVPAWLAVAFLHAGLLAFLLTQRASIVEVTRSDAIVVEFIPRVEAPSEPIEAPSAVADAPRRVPAKPRLQPAPSVALMPSAPAPAPEVIDKPRPLFRPDGGLQTPDTLLSDIDAGHRSRQGFDFQMPGVADAGKFMERPVALQYEPTRFDAYWKPDASLIDELLRRAMEATTKEVRIPIPGHPGSKIVCHVSMLLMAGSCGVSNNADGYVVERDDPNTLDEAEVAQCQAWWERIVSAESQDVWRKTRDLYERECRKPLLKRPLLPD